MQGVLFMSDFTFLTEEQFFESDKLDIIKIEEQKQQ